MTRITGNNAHQTHSRLSSSDSFSSSTQSSSKPPAWSANAIALLVSTDAFELKTARTGSAVKADPNAAVKQKFKDQFSAAASDPKQFHELMQTVYGKGYDRQAAESFRQKALAGDFSWLPEVRYASDSELRGANGAYDSASGTVFLNEKLKNDPEKAAATFVEEAGHHLDTKLNKTDAAGDEGELFRRLLSGEKLSKTQIAEIKAENDKGVITVDGKRMEVEFWNPFKKIKNAVKKVGSAIGNAVKSVGKAVGSVAKGVGSTIFHAVKGVGEGVGGFFSNLVKGKVGDAFSALGRGIDKGILQAPSRLAGGILDGAKHLLDGATGLLGPLGKPINWLGTRALDGARTAVDTVTGIVRDAIRTPFEVAKTFLSGQFDALKHLFKGEFGEAAKSFGKSFLDAGGRAIGGAADILFRAVAGAGSIIGTAIGLEQPARGLTDAEKAEFEKIYGDSIDLDQVRVKQGGLGSVGAARTVGNTIYLPNKDFDSNGELNADGRETLAHEMGHVWQNQNGGGDYMHKALFAQAKAALGSGSRNGAYDWVSAANSGTAFEDLNPEQQAHVIEDITLLLRAGDPIAAGSTVNGHTLTAAEAAYLNAAWDQVRNGTGAP